VVEALKDPETAALMAQQGADVVGGSPEQLAAYVHHEIPRWAVVAKQANVHQD
jgi:tripartite-type tricarboxylate transporter receptor subunit TctC